MVSVAFHAFDATVRYAGRRMALRSSFSLLTAWGCLASEVYENFAFLHLCQGVIYDAEESAFPAISPVAIAALLRPCDASIFVNHIWTERPKGLRTIFSRARLKPLSFNEFSFEHVLRISARYLGDPGFVTYGGIGPHQGRVQRKESTVELSENHAIFLMGF